MKTVFYESKKVLLNFNNCFCTALHVSIRFEHLMSRFLGFLAGVFFFSFFRYGCAEEDAGTGSETETSEKDPIISSSFGSLYRPLTSSWHRSIIIRFFMVAGNVTVTLHAISRPPWTKGDGGAFDVFEESRSNL